MVALEGNALHNLDAPSDREDRLTKFWAEGWLLKRHGGALEVIPACAPALRAKYGVAFSMLAGGRWLIVALNALLIAAIIGIWRPKSRRAGFCASGCAW
jgi:lipoprotein signal peptidase